MIELKGHQQKEMESKLLFHSHLTVMVQTVVSCWNRCTLAPWKVRYEGGLLGYNMH